MSARAHVDVNERRLRPIYDSLDYGNNKKAIQEADKVLKKQKDFPCAKALKGLAMLRLGRVNEGTTLLKEVHTSSPTDEATLQAMVISYRELHRLDLIADMYSNAHKAKPESEDILTALFMAYVRLSDYKKQQQTAMTLHRLKPTKNPYYFWAVMSIFMQAISDEKLGNSMFLPLAERMTEKYVKDEKIEAEAEVKLYLLILEEMGKFEKALEVINGPLGEKLNCDINLAKSENARFLCKLDQWSSTNAAYRSLMQEEPDQWSYYVEYFKSLLKLLESSSSEDSASTSEEFDDTADKALRFIESLVVEAEHADRPIRGPYLGQLELSFILTQTKSLDATSMPVRPLDLLLQYYTKFGDKNCCFGDIKKYCSLLTKEDETELLRHLQEECPKPVEFSDDTVVQSYGIKAMQRHQTLLQLSRYLGQHRKLENEQRSELLADLFERYNKALAYGKSLTMTEFQYGDMYILIICHILHDTWKQTGDYSFLWHGLFFLEKGLSQSVSNYQMKLLLIRFYCTIGAFGPCSDLYGSLEIKHIQNDALGYLICNHVGRLGHFNSAGVLYDGMLRFFTSNHKDTTEHLISSYKYGSFTQVREFVKFRERLQNSMQYASATAERLLMDMTLVTTSHEKTEEILSYMDIDPEKDRTVWPDLRDNRDLHVLYCWDQFYGLSEDELNKKSFIEETAWLKVRNLTVRCLAAAVKLGQQSCPSPPEGSENHIKINNGDENRLTMAEVLNELANQLSEHIAFCSTVDRPEYPLSGPSSTRLRSFLALGVGQIFLDMISCVLYIQRLQESPGKLEDTLEALMASGLKERLSMLISENKGALMTVYDQSLEFFPLRLENLVHITETLGFMTLLAGVAHRIIKAKTGKRNKKKRDTQVTATKFESFESLLQGLKQTVNDLRVIVDDLDPINLDDQIKNLSLSDQEQISFKIDKDLQQGIWNKVQKSFHDSAKELEIYLDHKTKYLALLCQ